MNNYNLTYNFKPTYNVSSTYQTNNQTTTREQPLNNLLRTYELQKVKPYQGEGQQSLSATYLFESKRGYNQF